MVRFLPSTPGNGAFSSGSTYAYSILDESYRPDMSLREAADLAKRAVRHATFRDAFSGMCVCLCMHLGGVSIM